MQLRSWFSSQSLTRKLKYEPSVPNASQSYCVSVGNWLQDNEIKALDSVGKPPPLGTDVTLES